MAKILSYDHMTVGCIVIAGIVEAAATIAGVLWIIKVSSIGVSPCPRKFSRAWSLT
jgi:hypothetical protein